MQRVLNFGSFKQPYWYKVSDFKLLWRKRQQEGICCWLLFDFKCEILSSSSNPLCRSSYCRAIASVKCNSETRHGKYALNTILLNISQAFPFHCLGFFINSALYNILTISRENEIKNAVLFKFMFFHFISFSYKAEELFKVSYSPTRCAWFLLPSIVSPRHEWLSSEILDLFVWRFRWHLRWWDLFILLSGCLVKYLKTLNGWVFFCGMTF